MTAGLFRICRGRAMPYPYDFDEFKIVLEGEITVADGDGKTYKLKAGDLVRFSAGVKVEFWSRSSGLP